MSATAVSCYRQRIATAVAAGLGAGATETRHHPALFPSAASSIAHLEYAVHLPTTTLTGPRRRMRTAGGVDDGAEGARSASIVRIRWAYRLRIGTEIADLDAASDLEAAVFAALAAIPGAEVPVMVPESVSRSAARVEDAAEFQITTIELRLEHRTQLQ